MKGNLIGLLHNVMVGQAFYVFSNIVSIEVNTFMGTQVKLQKSGEKGRYHITVPKSIVETKGWEKGDQFEWDEISSQEMRLTRK